MIQRTPGQGPYAKTEREQRWLLGALPEKVADPVEIYDRYLVESTLRLREMRAGSVVVYKLGQKVRDRPDSPEVVRITNIYLTHREFELFSQLEGVRLHKTRWHWQVGDDVLSVDQCSGRLRGLILAEVERGPDDPYLAPPPLAVADVTNDDRFSGGHLAQLSSSRSADLLVYVAELVGRSGTG